MISEVNEGWNWKRFTANKIILENEFGNAKFITVNNDYWLISPVELICEKIAENELVLKQILNDSDYMIDWNVAGLVQIASR